MAELRMPASAHVHLARIAGEVGAKHRERVRDTPGHDDHLDDVAVMLAPMGRGPAIHVFD
jgi:hypothetical protein